MRKFIIIPLFYTALLVSSLSCKKNFLDVVPLGNQVAVTTDDYAGLMNDPQFYFQSSAGLNETVLMGDEVAAVGSFFITQGTPWMTRLFEWQDTIYQPNDMEPEMLQTELTTMYTVNKIINEVMGSSGGTDDQKKEIQAEAMATRAWINFQFINFYAKPYLASTASTDPGFPIIEQADISATNFTRGTVQAMYDFMIKDLQAAIAILPVKPVIATHMSKPAAEGLLGKVYLFMGRYSDAAPLFAAAFTDLAQSNFARLYDYNQTFAPGGAFLPIDPTTGPTSFGKNLNDLTEAIVSKVWDNTPNNYPLSSMGIVLAPWAAALYTPSDWRLLFYSANNPDGTPNTAGRLRKYGITFSRWGLQLPELYLLSAENKARLNDLAGAKADVETLRRNRMPIADAPVPPAIAGDPTALLKFIIDERTREFAAEAYRWYDMRRLSVDPVFAGQAFTHNLYNADGTTTVFTLNQPNRLVLKLPPTLTNAYPDMVNNP